MEYRLLGPVEVLDGDRPLPLGGYRQRLVLAVLLARAGRPLTTDSLVDAVWGEQPPRTARKTLQVYLTRLRRLLGDTVVQSTPGGYRLAVDDGAVDARRLASLADRGHELLPVDPAAAGDVLREALALWRGEPYGDLGGDPALMLDVEALRERRLTALADRVRADLDSGRTAGLLGELTGLLEEHPRDERLLGSLLVAQYRAGRQAQALTSYESYREALADELGAEPSPELRRLHAAILRHDPALGLTRRRTTEGAAGSTRNPYKGLRPFGPDDDLDFFGRDALVADLARRVVEQPLVTVVGPSGSGKSSAVLAGLVPALRAADPCWRVLSMVPGRQPFEALLEAASADREAPLRLPGEDDDVVRLAHQLRTDDAHRLLLVVDQLEECFEQGTDEAVRDRFVRALARAVASPDRPLTVLLAVRADALGRVLETALGALVAETIVGVVPLAPAELEAAAVGPARRVGVPVAPDLLAELVADMTDQPGALPQFQYALTEVFDQRDGPTLTLATYRALGGLRGVIARRAERSVQALDPQQRESARQIFLRLVTVGEDGRAVRRRVPRAALEALAVGRSSVTAVLETFDRARLLTFDRHPATGEATVEIAHEALLREWPRLTAWVATAHDELRLRRSLDAALAEWEESGRGEDFLLAGARLAQVEAWRQAGSVELTEPERTYLLVSQQHRDRAQQAEADRYARELTAHQQAARRLRWLVAVVTVAALVATGLGLLAARRSAQATAGERDAHVRELAASSSLALSSDPELGVLLALQAVQEAASSEEAGVAVTALHAAVDANRVFARTSGGSAVAFVDEVTVAVGGDRPRLVDARSGRTRARLPRLPSGSSVVELAASPRAGIVALGTDAGQVLLVSTNQGRRVRELADPRYQRAHRGAVAALALSADGRLLASVGEVELGPDRTLVVWDVATGDVVARPLNLAPGPAVAFSPDGSALAVAVGSGVEVRAIPSGTLLYRLSRPEGEVTRLAFTADATRLVTATAGATLQLWDLASRTVLATAQAPAPVTALALGAQTSTVVTGTLSGEVTVWQLTHELVRERTLVRLPTVVSDVALTSSGGLAGAAGLGTVLTLDLRRDAPREGPAWPASGPPVGTTAAAPSSSGVPTATQPVAVSADGALVATVLPDGTGVRVTELGSGESTVLDRRPGDSGEAPAQDISTVTGVAFHPSGRVLAIARTNGDLVHHSLETRNVTTGQVLARNETFLGLSPYFSGGLAYEPTGRWLAGSQCLDNGIPAILVDPETLRLQPTGQTDVLMPCGHRLSTDAAGRRLAVATGALDGANVLVVDPATGATAATLRHPQGVVDLALAPDGRRLLTVGTDGTGRVWDVDTGDVAHVLRGHRGPVTAAEWSASGRTVLTSGVDGTVRAWDADAGTPGVVLGGLPGQSALALTPDGRRLVTVSGGEARVWVWDTHDLVALATSRLNRTLTPSECDLHGIDDCPAA